MTTFTAAWEAVLGVEGGYVDHPADKGGPTCYGITERVARDFGYDGDMRQLPIRLAKQIAKSGYWDPLKLDDISVRAPQVAAELFEISYNMWNGAAGTFLQRALNALGDGSLYMDGEIGRKTLHALYVYLQRRGKPGEAVLVRMLNAQQACDYIRQVEREPAKRAFIYGWIAKRVK
jgi:lysozyme family protein